MLMFFTIFKFSINPSHFLPDRTKNGVKQPVAKSLGRFGPIHEFRHSLQVSARQLIPPAVRENHSCWPKHFFGPAKDIPDHSIVEYLLVGTGERGWFDKFQAVLVGRPKAWEFDKQKTTEEKATYRKEQKKAVIKTVRGYNKQISVIQNLDFGHTDPQIVLPMGNMAKVDSLNRKMTLIY